MPTLFDALKKRMGQQPAEAPVANQAQVQKVLTAKGGKAGSSVGPAASNIGEQAAVGQNQTATKQSTLMGRIAGQQLGQAASNQAAQTQAAKKQLATQRTTAENALATQAQGTREGIAANEDIANSQRTANSELTINNINAQADKQLAALASERGVTLDNLFSTFERSNRELEFRADAAQLEQWAFTLAMADKDYLSELDRVGRERQLTNAINFQQEMSEIVMGSSLSQYLDNIGFKTKMDGKERAWEQELQRAGANIKIDMAIEMLKDEGRQQVWTGAGNIISAVGTDLAKDDSTLAGLFSSDSPNDGTGPTIENAQNFDYGYKSTFNPGEGS